MRQGCFLIAILTCLALAAPAGAADPLRPRQWGLTMIGADAARASSHGAGATVAVIDTGAAFGHPDLQGRLVAGHDYVDGDTNPADGQGHGTHVAGIVAANAGNNVGVESVAPGARVLVVRVLDDKGSGDLQHVVEGIRWAADHGADVINLSLSPRLPIVDDSEEYDQAVDYALDRGIVVVAAAGNGLMNQGIPLPFCEQPSAEGRLLCVGAVESDGSPASYSNYGEGLGIAAPGGAGTGDSRDILSTLPSPPSGSAFEPYGYMAGTSQATPHVAGVAALLVSLGVRGQAATQRILATARDAGNPGPDPVYGAGIVDARAAVAGLRPASGGGGSGSTGGAGAGGDGAAGGTAGGGAAARVSVARALAIRTVLRRGIPVACTAAGAGRCRVVVQVGRRLIAAGSRRVTVGRRTVVVARLTRRGRLILGTALRRRRAVRATVRVSLPGIRTVRRTVLLRP
jgi:subtilisin family serine protease